MGTRLRSARRHCIDNQTPPDLCDEFCRKEISRTGSPRLVLLRPTLSGKRAPSGNVCTCRVLCVPSGNVCTCKAVIPSPGEESPHRPNLPRRLKVFSATAHALRIGGYKGCLRQMSQDSNPRDWFYCVLYRRVSVYLIRLSFRASARNPRTAQPPAALESLFRHQAQP